MNRGNSLGARRHRASCAFGGGAVKGRRHRTGNARARFLAMVLEARVLGALEENAQQEGSGRPQKPLDTPELHGLPIEQGGGAEDEANSNGGNEASDPGDKSYERAGGEAEGILDLLKLEEASPAALG